ncbi:MAG: MerR family transcriptional regulator [Acidobacteria bacterium]|nr:MerR family transcriptional regulator [Acidobacteriota bacterium]
MPDIDADLNSATFASSDVVELAGVTPRQLQWWDERHVVTPEQESHRRVYQPKDVIAIMVVADLRRRGFSLQKIRRVTERNLHREIERRQREILAGDSGLYVLTDGDALYVERRLDRIIGILKDSEQPMCLVSLADVVKRIVEYWKAKESRRVRDQLALF